MSYISLSQQSTIREDFQWLPVFNECDRTENLNIFFGSRSEPITPLKVTIAFSLTATSTTTDYWELIATIEQTNKPKQILTFANTKNTDPGSYIIDFPLSCQRLDSFAKVFFGVKTIGQPGTIIFQSFRFVYTL